MAIPEITGLLMSLINDTFQIFKPTYSSLLDIKLDKEYTLNVSNDNSRSSYTNSGSALSKELALELFKYFFNFRGGTSKVNIAQEYSYCYILIIYQ